LPDLETRIFALLSEGEKHYTELKQVIVEKEKICTNQTLSTRLKRLTKERKVTKELKPDRTTIYRLAPAYKNKGDSSSDIVALEKLIRQLDSVFREEALIEIKPTKVKESWIHEWMDRRYEHKPKLRFAFYLDNATKEKVDLFLRTGEVSGELKDAIHSAFTKISENIPLAWENKYWEMSLTGWNDSKNFSKWLTLAHGMRGVIFAVYDGKEYADRITESLKQLNRLQNGHESDIEFFDEIARRCNIANNVYYNPDADSMISWFYDKVVPAMRDLKDIYSYLDEAFRWYCWRVDEIRRPALETALISSAISELRRKGREIPIAKLEEILPYDILDFDAYFRMKLPLLTEDDKKKVLKFTLLDVLAEVKNPEEFSQGRDWTIYPDEYLTNITKLASKVEDAEVKIRKKGIPEIPKLESEPILNFKFIDKGSIMDFSDEPMVPNFKEYLNKPEKRNWLQECLDIGLPLYTSLPLEALGFRIKWII